MKGDGEDERMAHQAPPPYSDVPPVIGFQVPPGHQQMPMPQQPPVVLLQQPARTVVITSMVGLGPNSVQMRCPTCQQVVNTRITQDIASRAHITALVLCLIGCWPCMCIPYCMDSCRNTNHTCPNCNSFLGTFANA